MTIEGTVDGRRARRERNRAAVIDATIELLLDEGELPSAETVAGRAGVSVSSVFRYFDNLEDLQQQTVGTYFQRFGPLFEIPAIGEGTVADRIARLADARTRLHATVAPVARLVRTWPHDGSVVDETLARTRAALADQIRTHFAEEIAARNQADAEDLVAVVDALTSFEAWDLLRSVHGRSDPQIRRAWRTALRALLAPGPPT